MRLYREYPYIIMVQEQIVAGFGQLLSAREIPVGPGHLNGAPIALIHGLTYDRSLLRWASNWRFGAPWLRYALFWLRPTRDLELFEINDHGQICSSQPLHRCRALSLSLGQTRQDGGVIIERMILRQGYPN